MTQTRQGASPSANEPINPEPTNPLHPREEPADDAIDRGLPDQPEQYPDEQDMPLPND